MKKVRIHWRSYTREPAVASFRYRCLVPALGLEDRGVAVNHFSLTTQDACLEAGNDVLVLVKTVSKIDLELAQQAKALGQKVVLDLCDNLFFWADYYDNRSESGQFFYHTGRSWLLKAIIELTDAVVVPTVSLQKRIQDEFPTKRVLVIPDAMETEQTRGQFHGMWRKLAFNSYFGTPYLIVKYGLFSGTLWIFAGIFRRIFEAASEWLESAQTALVPVVPKIRSTYQSIVASLWPGIDGKTYRATLRNQKPFEFPLHNWVSAPEGDQSRLIWFGNAGIPGVFGLSDLKEIEPALTRVNERHPILLTVVSEPEPYLSHKFKTMPFPVRFVRWSMEKCNTEIRRSDIVLIPNPGNDFARHKSPNRAMLAFTLGKPVVATRTQSLEAFQDCILFDDFEAGICRYLESPELAAEHARRGLEISQREYHADRVVTMWSQLLEELVPATRTVPALSPRLCPAE